MTLNKKYDNHNLPLWIRILAGILLVLNIFAMLIPHIDYFNNTMWHRIRIEFYGILWPIFIFMATYTIYFQYENRK